MPQIHTNHPKIGIIAIKLNAIAVKNGLDFDEYEIWQIQTSCHYSSQMR